MHASLLLHVLETLSNPNPNPTPNPNPNPNPKVHASLLLHVLETLSTHLYASVEAILSREDALDLSAARMRLEARRETLRREQAHVSRILLKFQGIARRYRVHKSR